MAFDYKKEYRSFYLPGNKPEIVDVPQMNFIAVKGSGDPNPEDSEYKKTVGLLYGVAYTIKMSKKTDHRMEGYFDFVVPPLEGLWWQNENGLMDYSHKEDFNWISLIRLPDFVSREEFDWAIREASQKKKQDFSKVEYFSFTEGLCVQCMHNGPYDDEPTTVDLMNSFIEAQGYENDFSGNRRHHEIYLSDPRKTSPDKMKTVIRHPIRKKR